MDIRQRWRRLRRFLQHDIWHLPELGDDQRPTYPLRLLRIVVLAGRGFAADSLQLRASALVYYTLLSLVPVAALAFGLAKGFGLEPALEQTLRQRLAGQEEILDRVIQFARTMLANTKGGVVAGAGVLLLLWSVVRLLGNIEKSFNAIWGVEVERNPVRKLTDYLAITIVAPILLLISSSASVFISGRVTAALEAVGVYEPVSGLVQVGLELVPFVFIWLLLALLYLTMPNTSVSGGAGLTAGVVAGTLYQLLQFVYIQSQVGVSRYNAVYGSFAALPMFLIWLYISWLIVLVGAEVSFAVDNAGDYARERASAAASQARRRLLAVALATIGAGRFVRGEVPATAAGMAAELEVPSRLVHAVINVLVAAEILVEVRGAGEREPGYLPARDPEGITLAEVAEAYDRAARPGAEDPQAGEGEDLVPDSTLGEIADRWRALAGQMAASKDNLTLVELAAARDGDRR
ncbi:MAG: YhjD/YihY/BrkB family envelope integrity protein [bacterium]